MKSLDSDSTTGTKVKVGKGKKSVRDNVKCKEWERQRRDRLNEAFKSLAQLLPLHDPAKDLAKIDVLDKATQFIKEIRLSNSRLLTQQSQPDEKSKKIKELQDELNKLILRVKQLTQLLNSAKIPIPVGPSIKALGRKRLKWTKQLSNDNLENSRLSRLTQSTTGIHLLQNLNGHILQNKDLLVQNKNLICPIPTLTISATPLKETNPTVDSYGSNNCTESHGGAPQADKASVCDEFPEQRSNQNKLPICPTTTSQTQPSNSTDETLPVLLTTKSSGLPAFENPVRHSAVDNYDSPNNISTVLPDKQPNISNASLTLNCLQQPSATSNITFPQQTTYILTQYPISHPQPSVLTLGPSPRIILRKPPLSLSGDIPKVAIPALRRIVKALPPKRRKAVRLRKKANNAAKSSQTENISIQAGSVNSADPAGVSSLPSEHEPIVVDILDSAEGESDSTRDKMSTLNPTCIEVKILSENEKNNAEHSESEVLQSDTVCEMEVSASSEIVQLTVTTETCSQESPKKVNNSVSALSAEILIAASNIRDCKASIDNSEFSTATNKSAVLEESISEPLALAESSHSISSVSPSKNRENVEPARIILLEKDVQNENRPDTECVSTDKISECIARSIDLIEHPEAELMELGSDWGVNVGETNSPKSPLSPTQMFLSMFPLLPRESIVESSIQQSGHHSSVKSSGAQFGTNSRSSFYIDSMLPEQVHPQASAVDSPGLSASVMENSICLAMTPPVAPCLHQNISSNYSSPPTFQSLANAIPSHSVRSTNFQYPRTNVSSKDSPLLQPSQIVPTNTSSVGVVVTTRNTTKPATTTSATSTASSTYFPIQQEIPLQSKSHSVPKNLSTTSYETFQTLLPVSPIGNPRRNRCSTQQNYQPETFIDKPQARTLSTSVTPVSHTISQMFNSFVNNPIPPPPQPSYAFNECYSYYPQEMTNAHNPQNLIPRNTSNSNVLNKYSPQNNSRVEFQGHGQSNEVHRSIFTSASNTADAPRNTLLAPSISKQTDSSEGIHPPPDKHRLDVPNKNPPSLSGNTMERTSAQNVQTFTQQFSQPHPMQFPPREAMNSGQNPHGQETVSIQNSNPSENKNIVPQPSFLRSNQSGAPKEIPQHPVRAISSTEFNADFLAYSAPTPASTYNYSATHCPYDNTRSSVSHAPISTAVPKTSYNRTSMQNQPVAKSRRPPFYLPDPPVPPPPQPQPPMQYDCARSLPNYFNQNFTEQHYNNNFAPQFYSNNRPTTSSGMGGGNKEYQMLSNTLPRNNTKAGPDIYQNQSSTVPPIPQPQQQHQLTVEHLNPLNSKKPAAVPNFVQNTQQPGTSRTNPLPPLLQGQNQQHQGSRPVNWMTDPPHKKPPTGNAARGASNPFSVSKLVGNNSNNYCTEALIRKNPNPDWNDFHSFATSVPPPGSSGINLQIQSQGQFLPHSHSQPVNNEYFSQNYSNPNFGHFDPHHNPQHHYTNNANPIPMNPQSHGQNISNVSHPNAHNTTTSVSNFNLSSIFPEINDKRGNNSTGASNCGYYAGNNSK